MVDFEQRFNAEALAASAREAAQSKARDLLDNQLHALGQDVLKYVERHQTGQWSTVWAAAPSVEWPKRKRLFSWAPVPGDPLLSGETIRVWPLRYTVFLTENGRWIWAKRTMMFRDDGLGGGVCSPTISQGRAADAFEIDATGVLSASFHDDRPDQHAEGGSWFLSRLNNGLIGTRRLDGFTAIEDQLASILSPR